VPTKSDYGKNKISFYIRNETCILKVPCVTLRDNTERPYIRSSVLWRNTATTMAASLVDYYHRVKIGRKDGGDL